MKKQWAVINELLERNIKQQHSISKLVNTFVTASKICIILNDYFVNVGPNLSAKIDNVTSTSNNISSNTNLLFFQPIKPLEVYQKIIKAKSEKSSRP